jgi:ADP-heptose:LPS heptosyltransferase
MQKLILKTDFPPGDVVLLTAAVRDLHLCHPGQFQTDVRTLAPDLWQGNPHLTSLSEDDPEVTLLDCQTPLVNRSTYAPYHVIQGFMEFLNDALDLKITPTAFKGDIHLSADERCWCSQVQEITQESVPFWIVVAGGKYDFTTKWWDSRRYQQVVDHFRGKILFVQVGDTKHRHPALRGVIDLRGRTNLRQLLRLVYHAQGVLTPVSLLMHLAAAVPIKGGKAAPRPCVVVAGGREPPQWEAYPHHQFIHTVGALPCCVTTGCWKSRTIPLGDGQDMDRPENLCLDVVDGLPHCMELITAEEVIHRIEMHFRGGIIDYLSPHQAMLAQVAVDEEGAAVLAARG